MSKHTKAPWKIVYASLLVRRPISIYAHDGSICSFNAHRWDRDTRNATANARLIEAAPLLYEAVLCSCEGRVTPEHLRSWVKLISRINGGPIRASIEQLRADMREADSGMEEEDEED